MKTKILSKILSFAIITAFSLNMGVAVFVDEINYVNSQTNIGQVQQGFNYVVQAGKWSLQSSNPHINGEIQETDELINLDNGIMLMLDSDTQVIANGYCGGTAVKTESNIYGSDVYSADGVNVNINHTIVAENNIYLTGEMVYGENAILYSKNGNISINCNKLIDFKGIIYAPNGTVHINGANVKIEGTIIAKEVYVQSDNFTLNS